MKTLTIAMLLLPLTAFAYFDPGTGSLLIQALIGALAGITIFWGHVKLFFRSLFFSNKGESVPGNNEENNNIADQNEDAKQ